METVNEGSVGRSVNSNRQMDINNCLQFISQAKRSLDDTSKKLKKLIEKRSGFLIHEEQFVADLIEKICGQEDESRISTPTFRKNSYLRSRNLKEELELTQRKRLLSERAEFCKNARKSKRDDVENSECVEFGLQSEFFSIMGQLQEVYNGIRSSNERLLCRLRAMKLGDESNMDDQPSICTLHSFTDEIETHNTFTDAHNNRSRSRLDNNSILTFEKENFCPLIGEICCIDEANFPKNLIENHYEIAIPAQNVSRRYLDGSTTAIFQRCGSPLPDANDLTSFHANKIESMPCLNAGVSNEDCTCILGEDRRLQFSSEKKARHCNTLKKTGVFHKIRKSLFSRHFQSKTR